MPKDQEIIEELLSINMNFVRELSDFTDNSGGLVSVEASKAIATLTGVVLKLLDKRQSSEGEDQLIDLKLLKQQKLALVDFLKEEREK